MSWWVEQEVWVSGGSGEWEGVWGYGSGALGWGWGVRLIDGLGSNVPSKVVDSLQTVVCVECQSVAAPRSQLSAK